MKTTKGNAYDAAMTINLIIENSEQEIPQTVAYRLAKIYQKIRKIGLEVERHMKEQAQVFGQVRQNPAGETTGWEVPEGEKREKYNKAVAALREQEIELDVIPIPIAAFGNRPNGLKVNQFYHLGDFVVGDLPEEQLGQIALGQDR